MFKIFLGRKNAIGKIIFGSANTVNIISNYFSLDITFHLMNSAFLELGETPGVVLVWNWCGSQVPGTRNLVYSLTVFLSFRLRIFRNGIPLPIRPSTHCTLLQSNNIFHSISLLLSSNATTSCHIYKLVLHFKLNTQFRKCQV